MLFKKRKRNQEEINLTKEQELEAIQYLLSQQFTNIDIEELVPLCRQVAEKYLDKDDDLYQYFMNFDLGDGT